MERVHINAVIDPTTDFDCTSNFFSDYKTVKDFYIQANLIKAKYIFNKVVKFIFHGSLSSFVFLWLLP